MRGTAAASVMAMGTAMPGAAASDGAAAAVLVEEKTACDVILNEPGPHTMTSIQVVRAGELVSCTFTEEQANEINRMTHHYVRVTGTVTTNLVTGKTGDVRVHTIEPFKEFWQVRTLDALAMEQEITSPTDLNTLYGTWPGAVDDLFEEFINRLRKGNCAE